MKTTIFLALLLVSQLGFAQTLKEKRIKSEMLDRVDSLIGKIVDARQALKIEDVVLACDKIDEMFKILPDHLMAVGTNMDLFDSKIVKMENESKIFLIDIHMRSIKCSPTKDAGRGENLDIKETDKRLKKMKSALEKQKKRIKKEETNFSNNYSYYYEFN